jgi:hypothetical protein
MLLCKCMNAECPNQHAADVPEHECIVQKERDVFAYVEQFNVRCRCHMDMWQLWRPGDAPKTCPVSGVSLTDGEALGGSGA